jgi:hypothetical protein
MMIDNDADVDDVHDGCDGVCMIFTRERIH